VKYAEHVGSLCVCVCVCVCMENAKRTKKLYSEKTQGKKTFDKLRPGSNNNIKNVS